jgi:hypothetical protein
MNGYRDELDAARLRIGTLEAQLAEQAAEVVAREASLRARQAELEEARAKLRQRGRPSQAATLLALLAMAGAGAGVAAHAAMRLQETNEAVTLSERVARVAQDEALGWRREGAALRKRLELAEKDLDIARAELRDLQRPIESSLADEDLDLRRAQNDGEAPRDERDPFENLRSAAAKKVVRHEQRRAPALDDPLAPRSP